MSKVPTINLHSLTKGQLIDLYVDLREQYRAAQRGLITNTENFNILIACIRELVEIANERDGFIFSERGTGKYPGDLEVQDVLAKYNLTHLIEEDPTP